MINLTKDIYDLLSSTTAVTDLAGNRIWGERSTPIKTWRPATGVAVAFQLRGGQTAYDARIWRVNYKFKVYSQSESTTLSPPSDAFDLYSVIYDTLQDAQFSNWRWSGADMLPQALEEFALNWPYLMGSFEFAAING